MTPKGCEAYFQLFKQNFSWLFEEFAFTVVSVNDLGMDSCSYLLQSGACRLFLGVDRGRMGPVQITMVPDHMGVTADLSELAWYWILDVIHYARGRFPDPQEVRRQAAKASRQTLEQYLADLAAECRSVWPHIMQIFREERFESEKAKLDVAIRTYYSAP